MNLIVCLVQHEHNYLPVGNAPEHSVYRVCFKHNYRTFVGVDRFAKIKSQKCIPVHVLYNIIILARTQKFRKCQTF